MLSSLMCFGHGRLIGLGFGSWRTGGGPRLGRRWLDHLVEPKLRHERSHPHERRTSVAFACLGRAMLVMVRAVARPRVSTGPGVGPASGTPAKGDRNGAVGGLEVGCWVKSGYSDVPLCVCVSCCKQGAKRCRFERWSNVALRKSAMVSCPESFRCQRWSTVLIDEFSSDQDLKSVSKICCESLTSMLRRLDKLARCRFAVALVESSKVCFETAEASCERLLP
ncbi:pentatricopeptide repeat-containing protein [Dorcoceras hygrometricum]|uniref:Pentatricopeptide repeat-containing protein n=1 Tax=Dorcoceras hygrometricum TaxID=472368 RepID=A0A2Z7A9Y7_9LAMI|nr:pentatricopeptide repeat-containing protein [Dorcoceras hygrometricum]